MVEYTFIVDIKVYRKDFSTPESARKHAQKLANSKKHYVVYYPERRSLKANTVKPVLKYKDKLK